MINVINVNTDKSTKYTKKYYIEMVILSQSCVEQKLKFY